MYGYKSSPVATASNLLLIFTFVKINTRTLVDIDWSLNHFPIGVNFYVVNPHIRSFASLILAVLGANAFARTCTLTLSPRLRTALDIGPWLNRSCPTDSSILILS